MGRLGAACCRHRWLTVVVWIAGVACLITLWTRFGAAADNSFTGSDRGQALLNEHFAGQSGDTLTLAIRSTEKITSPEVQARVTQALAPFRAAPHVTGVSDPYTTPGHLAADGHIAYATIQFDVQGSDIPGSEATALMGIGSGLSLIAQLGHIFPAPSFSPSWPR